MEPEKKKRKRRNRRGEERRGEERRRGGRENQFSQTEAGWSNGGLKEEEEEEEERTYFPLITSCSLSGKTLKASFAAAASLVRPRSFDRPFWQKVRRLVASFTRQQSGFKANLNMQNDEKMAIKLT